MKATEERESGPSWALLRLRTGVEAAPVEWGAEEGVSPNLEATCYPSSPPRGKLVRAPAGNGRTPRWFPALRGRDAPRRPTAGGAGGFQGERCGDRSFLVPGSHPAAVTPVLQSPRDLFLGAL